MKKLTSIVSIVVVAAFLALIGVASVSANSRTGETVAERIQNQEFYSKAANIYGDRTTGVHYGPDVLSFSGLKASSDEMRVGDLFTTTQTPSLRLVHFTVAGNKLVVAPSDLPAGVSSYYLEVAKDENSVVLHETKNGVTRSLTGYAISEFSANLAQAEYNH